MKLKPSNQATPGLSAYINLPGVARPAFADTLCFPADMTQLAAQNVSELLGKYTALQAFALHEQAVLQVAELGFEREEAFLQAAIMGERPNIQHLERWRRDAVVNTDARWLALQNRIRTVRQRKLAVGAFVTIYEKYCMALSRELSRKTSSNDGMRHASTKGAYVR